MLVNGITTKATHPHKPFYVQSLSDERAEVLRRLRRQLEQAQRDLERAQCEQNHNAVIRLRYRIIPQLEQQIQHLEQDSCPPPGNSPATTCFKAMWHIQYRHFSAGSRTLFSEDYQIITLEMPTFYCITKREKRQY